MPIEMRLFQDLYCPFVVCDVCKRPIIGSGNFEYKIITNGDYKPIGPIYFTHKQHSHALRLRVPLRDNEMWHWNNLERFIVGLFVNFAETETAVDSPLVIYLTAFGAKLSPFVDIDNEILKDAGLYFLFDDNGELNYIGQSKQVYNRLKNGHHIYKPNHRIRIAPISITEKREAAEMALIKLLSPPLNTVYT